jgi:hypothetical protein
MRVQIRFRVVTDDGTIISDDEIACFDRGDDRLEDIGLSLREAKERELYERLHTPEVPTPGKK